MYGFISEGVKISYDIMVEATAVNTIEVNFLESYHSSSRDVLFDGNGCWGNLAKFGPFCSKGFSSGVSFFLGRLITNLCRILQEVEGMSVVLKVFVILKAILEVVVDALEIRCLGLLIWVFLYCRNVFSLLLKIMFCRFVKIGPCIAFAQISLC